MGALFPGDEYEVAVVWVWRANELGLRRGAEEDEEDKPRRERSTLKLDRRERGGNGEEAFRPRR